MHPRPIVRLSVVLVVLVLAALVAGAVPSGAANGDLRDQIAELEQRRERNRDDQAVARSDVDALTVDVEGAEAELARLQQEAVDAHREAVDARRAADLAAADAARSSSSADLAASALATARQRTSAVAVERYVGGPGRFELDRLLRGDLFGVATADAALEAVVASDRQAADEIDDAAVELAGRRDRAGRATTKAQRLAEEALRANARADDARADYEGFVEGLRSRLDHRLSEAAALERLDADLAADIRAREQALARLVPPRPRGGGFTIPQPVGPEETTVVAGFRVHTSVAERVAAMMAAATADGITFTGGGYRDAAGQIALRQAHCGPTDYDIYERPSSECRPPTARPTTSMHERGLALDLSTPERGLIVSRNDPAFLWLALNAARYGFYNLPSEPWHWSTSGS